MMAKQEVGNTALGAATCRFIEQFEPEATRLFYDPIVNALVGTSIRMLMQFKSIRAFNGTTIVFCFYPMQYHTIEEKRMKIAIPDDYQDAVRTLDSFQKLNGQHVVVIREHISQPEILAARLQVEGIQEERT